MATIAPTRQPFGVLNSSRLQALGSAKNRQNAVTALIQEKTFFTPSSKRRCPDAFEDDFDTENIDPSIFNSPSKKAKSFDGTPKKVSKFSLTTVPSSARAAPTSNIFKSPIVPQRHALSSPPTATATPIAHSRGSPKHKRVGVLSKRRTTNSPFKRIDPPSFGAKSAGLPFSLDAALSGSISSYKPVAEQRVSTLEDSMPKSWFFNIYEDTPEEEATNLMEHSACILDISSDDDCKTKLQNDAKERGKENVPPSDFIPSPSSVNSAAGSALHSLVQSLHDQAPATLKTSISRKTVDFDAMVEDRSPLGDLRAADYYGAGLDATSHVIVDGTATQKPSSLSKEILESPARKETKYLEEAVQGEVQKFVEVVSVWEDNGSAEGPAEGAVSQVMAEALLWEDEETAAAGADTETAASDDTIS